MITTEKIVNIETKSEEIIQREMTAEEIAEHERLVDESEAFANAVAAKAAARQALLDRLGITAEEAALLGL